MTKCSLQLQSLLFLAGSQFLSQFLFVELSKCEQDIETSYIQTKTRAVDDPGAKDVNLVNVISGLTLVICLCVLLVFVWVLSGL